MCGNKVKNRLNDVFFKNLLGDNRRKNLTINFLNSILDRNDTDQIVDVQFMDKEQQPDIQGGKLSILDILAKTNDNSIVNIEVQVANQSYIALRSIYYWSKLFASELPSGGQYNKLKPVIYICLLDFTFLPYGLCSNPYHISHDITHEPLNKHLEFNFIELPNLKIKDIKKLTRSESWFVYFSKKYTDEEREEIAMTNPAIKEALSYESYFTQNEELRREYDLREKAIKDYNSNMYAFKEAGRKEGKEEGIKEGIQLGKQEGKDEEKIENAIDFLKLGTAPEIVSKGVKLPLETIMELKRKLDI